MMQVRSCGQMQHPPSDREQLQLNLCFPLLQESADEAGIHRGEYIQSLPDTFPVRSTVRLYVRSAVPQSRIEIGCSCNCTEDQIHYQCSHKDCSKPNSNLYSLKSTASRIPPTIHRRVLCARIPTMIPAASAIMIAACFAPGPPSGSVK